MSSGQIKTTTVVKLDPFEDHTGSRGYFVNLVNGTQSKLVTAATDVPYGVILDGDVVGGEDAIAVLGGNVGSIRVKAGGACTHGSKGQLTASGEVVNDTAAGARTIVCEFLEDGVQDEWVEAIIFKPESIGHAVVLTSAQLVANPLEADFNKLQADVAALNTALKAAAKLA